MNKNDDVRVAEIAARAEAATEGPWSRSRHYKLNIISDATGQIITGHATPNSTNAEFIAHAREDIPFLLSEVRRLRSVVEDAERVIAEAPHANGCSSEKVIHECERDIRRGKCDCWKSTYQAGADHE